MKELTLLLAIYSPEPMRSEKPPCWWCRETGAHVDIWKSLWYGRVMRTPCESCGGYGREKTIYGGLLRERR